MKYDQYLFLFRVILLCYFEEKNENYVILYAVEKIKAILFLGFFFIFSLVPYIDLRIETCITHTFEEASFL